MALVPTDVQSDRLLVDGIETITYTPSGGSGASLAGVKRGSLTIQQAAGLASLGIEASDVPFSIPGVNLASGVVPSVGDSITDSASVVYTVIAVTYGRTTNKYRVIGRKQR